MQTRKKLLGKRLKPSVQIADARLNLATGVAFGEYLSSGSLPTFPTRMTLFMLFGDIDTIFWSHRPGYASLFPRPYYGCSGQRKLGWCFVAKELLLRERVDRGLRFRDDEMSATIRGIRKPLQYLAKAGGLTNAAILNRRRALSSKAQQSRLATWHRRILKVPCTTKSAGSGS